MYHNDYLNAVREYLFRYREFSQYIKNLKVDIIECDALLGQDAAPATPSFSPTGGCGGGESISQEERLFMRREEIQRKRDHYKAELTRIEPTMNRIDQSLKAMAEVNPVDKTILVDRYVDKVSWDRTARNASCSIGYCRKRARIALENLTVMVCGIKAVPAQNSNLVFFDNGANDEGHD